MVVVVVVGAGGCSLTCFDWFLASEFGFDAGIKRRWSYSATCNLRVSQNKILRNDGTL